MLGLGGLCPPRKPLEEMDYTERNKYIHAAMVGLASKDWPEVRKLVGDLWKPVEGLLRRMGASPLEEQKVVRHFWKHVGQLGIPEVDFIAKLQEEPRRIQAFTRTLLKFYDAKSGTLDEVGLTRALDKSKNFRHMYYKMRGLVSSYLDTLRLETPRGGRISPASVLAKMREVAGEVPVPEAVGEPLTPDGFVARMGEMLQTEREATKTPLETIRESFLGTMFSSWLPTKGMFRRIGEKFGGEYSKVWEEGEQRRLLFDRRLNARYREIKDALGPYLKNTQVRERLSYIIERAAEDPEHPMHDYMVANPATTEELKLAQRVRGLFNKWGQEFEIPLQMWEENYLPRIRQMDTFDLDRFSPKDPMYPFLQRFFVHARVGDLNPREVDILERMRSYIRIGEKQKVFDSDGWLTRATELNKKLPRNGREHEIMSEYLADIVTSNSIRLSRKLRSMEVFADAIEAHTGIPKGTVKALGALYLKTIYAGALGFRAIPLFKQVMQTTLLGGGFFGKYLLDGIKAAGTREAWEYINQLHIPVEFLGTLEHGADIEAVLGRLPEGAARTYSKWLEKSTWAYMKADTLNRVVSFFAGKSMFERATRDFWDGKIDEALWRKMVKYRWFDGFSDFQRELDRARLASGDEVALRKAADLYGTHVTEDLNWVYRRGNSPLVMRKHPYIFQFGTWPANFAELMTRHMEYAQKTGDFSMLLRMAAIGGGTYLAGQGAGLDLRSLYAWPSVFYTMGPIPKTGIDLIRWMQQEYYGSPLTNMGKKEFYNDLSVYMPCGLAAKQLVSGYASGDLAMAFGLHNLVNPEFQGFR